MLIYHIETHATMRRIFLVFIGALLLVVPMGNIQSVIGHSWVDGEYNNIGQLAGVKSALVPSIANWTFMVYMDADNSLSSNSYADINEMENGINSSTDRVNVIVLWDLYGNNNTKLVKVESGTYVDISGEATSWLKSEMDMGSPATLVDFVNWTVHNYPARHYFLDLWDHGGAYHGAMYDETSGDTLSLNDLLNASEHIVKDIGRALDIVGYDACLMDAGADNYQIKTMANIIVASEHTEGDDGWDYASILGNLTSNPNQTPVEFAYNFVNIVDPSGTSVHDMFAINTTVWDYYFMPAYNGLAQALRQVAGTYDSEIQDAFNNTAEADSSYWPAGKDVGDFAKQVKERIPDPEVQYWASRVIENASKAVINHFDHDTGRKMIMSETSSLSEANSHSDAKIFQDYKWEKMLNQVYNLGVNDTNIEPWCSISSPEDISEPQNYVLNLRGTAGDSDGTVREVQMKVDTGYWENISSSSSWEINISLLHFSVGTHHIFFRSYDGDLYSNITSVVINVKLRTDLPDLTFKNITISNTEPNAGEWIEINMTVENTGNNTSAPANVSIYLDNINSKSLLFSWTTGTLSVGSEDWHAFSWNTSGYAGYHRLIFYIDPENKIEEINESNNEEIRNVAVLGYSFDLQSTETTIYAHRGENKTFTFSAINTGTYTDEYYFSYGSPAGWNLSISKSTITLEPNESMEIYISVSIPSSAPFHTPEYINISAESQGNSSVRKSLNFTLIVLPKILLVADDGEYGDYKYMASALNVISINYDLWNISSNGTITSELLKRYPAVLWTTGRAISNLLPENEQNALSTYLNSGGHLYMSSQDLLFELVPGRQGEWVTVDNTFVKNYLHIVRARNDVILNNITGVRGDMITGNFTNITLAYPFNNYDDEIQPAKNAYPIFRYSDSNCSGLRYANATYRVVFTAFSFEAVENASPELGVSLLRNIITWLLRNYTLPAAPGNLTAAPGDGYVRLTWDPVNGAAKYVIYRNGEIIATVSASQHEFTDTNVFSGQTYAYYITALNDFGEGKKSNEVSATPYQPVPELSYFAILALVALLTIFRRR